MRTLGTLGGVSLLAHQIGGGLSVWLAGKFYDLTGGYDFSFTLATIALVGASLVSFSIAERRYSMRYYDARSIYSGRLIGTRGRVGERKIVSRVIHSFAPSPPRPCTPAPHAHSPHVPQAEAVQLTLGHDGIWHVPAAPESDTSFTRPARRSPFQPLAFSPVCRAAVCPYGSPAGQPSHTRSDARHLRLARLLSCLTVAGPL